MMSVVTPLGGAIVGGWVGPHSSALLPLIISIITICPVFRLQLYMARCLSGPAAGQPRVIHIHRGRSGRSGRSGEPGVSPWGGS